jgi:hypothetical protein
MSESQFAREQRWRDQQARLMEEDRRALAHERFFVPSDEEVAEELKRRAEIRSSRNGSTNPPAPHKVPTPFVDQLSRGFLDSLTKERLITIAQELYVDSLRLRRELDAANGVNR